MSLSYPIGLFKFTSVAYNRDIKATAWADCYCTRPFNPNPTYMFYFRRQWRTMIYCTIGRTCRKYSKYGDGSYKEEVMSVYVMFSGLTQSREIQLGTEIPFSYTFDHKAILENRWYGQRYGLPLEEGMYEDWRKVKIDPTEVINVNWATDFHGTDSWRQRWAVARKIRLVHAARNRLWSRT